MKIWLLQINLHLYVERFAFVVGIGGGEIKYTVNFSVTQGNLEGKLEVWSEGIYYFWSEVSLLSHRMSSLSCVHAAQNPPSLSPQQAFFLVESQEAGTNTLDIVVPTTMVGTKYVSRSHTFLNSTPSYLRRS